MYNKCRPKKLSKLRTPRCATAQWGWREVGGVDGMDNMVQTVVHVVIVGGILFGAYMLIMYGTAYLYGL